MKRLLAVCLCYVLLVCTSVFAQNQNIVQKEWTFMVFLNGNNNLDDFGPKDIDEMKKVGSTDQLNIVVQHASYSATLTKRLYVKKGGTEVVQTLGDVDMGSWKNLVDFVKWGIQKYPAKKYAVVIWNHGSGWEIQSVDPVFKGISYDDKTGNHITTPELKTAFAEIKKFNNGKNIDIVGHDACLMAMFEVGYEMKDSVNYFVGSEETEPGDGWAYDKSLEKIAANPSLDAKDFSKILVQEYVKSYNNGSQGSSDATQSSVDLAAYNQFLPVYNDYVNYLISKMDIYKNYYINAVDQTQGYAMSEYKDFLDFVKNLNDNIGSKDSDLNTKTNNLIAAFHQVVIDNASTGSRMINSNGISIFIPSKYLYEEHKIEYQKLDFSKDAKWDEFLQALLEQ